MTAGRRRGLAAAVVLVAALGCDVVPHASPRAEAAPPLVPATAGAPGSARQGADALDGGMRAVVERVADGDSFVVALRDGGQAGVRLQGVDAPEARQPGGREAAEHLRRMADGREVTLHVRGRDPYGRFVAVAVDGDGDLGLRQIRAGHAWYYRRYAHEQDRATRERYDEAERSARARRLGLWAAAAPVAPWDFKAEQRGDAVAAAPSSPTGRAGRVVGNRNSRLYHLPGCPGHAEVSPRNAVPFDSAAAAEAAGYRRAGNCR